MQLQSHCFKQLLKKTQHQIKFPSSFLWLSATLKRGRENKKVKQEEQHMVFLIRQKKITDFRFTLTGCHKYDNNLLSQYFLPTKNCGCQKPYRIHSVFLKVTKQDVSKCPHYGKCSACQNVNPKEDCLEIRGSQSLSFSSSFNIFAVNLKKALPYTTQISFTTVTTRTDLLAILLLPFFLLNKAHNTLKVYNYLQLQMELQFSPKGTSC